MLVAYITVRVLFCPATEIDNLVPELLRLLNKEEGVHVVIVPAFRYTGKDVDPFVLDKATGAPPFKYIGLSVPPTVDVPSLDAEATLLERNANLFQFAVIEDAVPYEKRI